MTNHLATAQRVVTGHWPVANVYLGPTCLMLVPYGLALTSP